MNYIKLLSIFVIGLFFLSSSILFIYDSFQTITIIKHWPLYVIGGIFLMIPCIGLLIYSMGYIELKDRGSK